MKNQTKIIVLIFTCLMLLSAGTWACHWYYKEYVLPMREARPILQAFKAKKSMASFFVYPNANKNLLTGRTARIIRREFLHVLETTDDPNTRRELLFIIVYSTIEDSSWSRIQFEDEDWEIIARAADRMNQEDGNTPNGTGKWSIFEHKGHKILSHPIPASR